MSPDVLNAELVRLVVEFITENFDSGASGLSGGHGSPAGAGNGPSGPDSADAGYVEGPADHAFTAFLAGLTPSRVLRERETSFSKVERKRKKYLTETTPAKPVGFTDRQLQIAMDVLARKDGGRE